MYRIKNEIVVSASGVVAIPVPSTTTVYTKSFPMEDGIYFDMATLGAGTTLDIKIEFEQSHVEPVTEGAADTYWSESITDIAANHSAKTYVHYDLSPKTAKFGRFKLTGQGANTADATLQIWVAKQGQY